MSRVSSSDSRRSLVDRVHNDNPVTLSVNVRYYNIIYVTVKLNSAGKRIYSARYYCRYRRALHRLCTIYPSPMFDDGGFMTCERHHNIILYHLFFFFVVLYLTPGYNNVILRRICLLLYNIVHASLLQFLSASLSIMYKIYSIRNYTIII